MEIRQEFPPNIREIRKTFDISDLPVVFTYGNILYNPTGEPVSDDLMIHEQVHEKQQAIIGVNDWWVRYLEDKTFRLTQEVEAYQAQLKSVQGTRDYKRQFLQYISKSLASKLYGNILTWQEAKELIKNYD